MALAAVAERNRFQQRGRAEPVHVIDLHARVDQRAHRVAVATLGRPSSAPPSAAALVSFINTNAPTIAIRLKNPRCLLASPPAQPRRVRRNRDCPRSRAMLKVVARI
ncbi:MULTISPECIES: hypothetical protein [unclassified Burkholderia]|uniref:hypothetical protein n=1 Tax=unclassified Burkholderia TaxID=2613784 RepID=UPI0016284FA5|nr:MULTISPECIES: hypothetical protein [unclassified Burkholderia]